MPILNVLLSGPAQEQKTQQVAQMLGEFTSRILRKKPELTSITDETNTRLEKAAYIQAVYDGLLNLMPDLHHESYIHVDDVRAGAYGYGGKTQEYRAHQT
jgi:4-oxalocrotonate tautomerase